MNATSLHLLLRILVIADGRSPEQIIAITGVPRSTLKRYLAIARRFGAAIDYDRDAGHYVVADSGVFDLERVKILQ